MFLLFVTLQRFTPHFVHSLFGKLQIFSAAWMAHSHGTNDAQKTMGIITLALFTGTKAGSFDHLPGWLDFLKTPVFALPVWVTILCAGTMAVGTAAGGWRIIRTLGHRMVKLQPVHGFAAETSAALIIQGASYYGIPLSTTHVISTSIMGVGAVKRFSGMKWRVVERIMWAWLLLCPQAASSVTRWPAPPRRFDFAQSVDQRSLGGSIPNFSNIFLTLWRFSGVSNFDSSGYSAQNSTSR